LTQKQELEYTLNMLYISERIEIHHCDTNSKYMEKVVVDSSGLDYYKINAREKPIWKRVH